MNKILIKQALIFCLVFLSTWSVSAQFTETFESPPNGATVFNSNGQSFTLTSAFEIFSSRAGYGYNSSKGFVDNSSNPALNQINSIKTTDAALFTVKSLWMYVSTNEGANPSSDGSVIITGLKGGVPQYTINLITGFSTSFVPNNGFGYFDFTTAGGSDHSNIQIDQLQFQLQGNFDYIGIDNFTWAPLSALPISLLSYSANLQSDGQVKLSWQTAYENNTSQFVIGKSTDGSHFHTIGSVTAAGYSNVTLGYGFFDASLAPGTNYYRLDEVDKDGTVKQLGVRTVSKYDAFSKATVYPNPVTGNSFTLNTGSMGSTGNTYLITDMSGRVLQRGTINSVQQEVPIPQVAPGNYTIQLSNGEVVRWIKK